MWLLQTYRVHFGCKGSRSPRSPTKGCLRAGLACTQRAEPQAAMLLIYHRPSLSCELGAAGEPALPPRHIALRSSRASSSQPPPQVFQQGLQKDRLPSWLLPLLSTSVSFLTLDQSYIEWAKLLYSRAMKQGIRKAEVFIDFVGLHKVDRVECG